MRVNASSLWIFLFVNHRDASLVINDERDNFAIQEEFIKSNHEEGYMRNDISKHTKMIAMKEGCTLQVKAEGA